MVTFDRKCTTDESNLPQRIYDSSKKRYRSHGTPSKFRPPWRFTWMYRIFGCTLPRDYEAQRIV